MVNVSSFRHYWERTIKAKLPPLSTVVSQGRGKQQVHLRAFYEDEEVSPGNVEPQEKEAIDRAGTGKMCVGILRTNCTAWESLRICSSVKFVLNGLDGFDRTNPASC